MAELSSARGDSPVTSTTTTAVSSTPTSASHPKSASIFSGSTATSFSCGSPHQQSQFPFQSHVQSQSTNGEAAVTALKEKHSAEMEALLGALADSQRTSKAVKDENQQLHGRIRDLEDQIGDLIEQLDAARRMPPPPPSFARSVLNQSRPASRSSSVEGNVSRRTAQLHSYVHSSRASLADDTDSVSAFGQHTTTRDYKSRLSPSRAGNLEHVARKRASTASSVFPALPSNMSMLLHDDGDIEHDHTAGYVSSSHARSQNSSPQPTPVLYRMDKRTGRHAGKPSVSSVGSGASLSGEMSILSSLPGSPTSLRLRPEHEKHLSDMISFDLSVVDSD
ncbi:hypothetical protein EW145_g7755 [Phellinidium pouzarii]|uniref:Uncharacterized protein n=1 Tax=Phellinidium pouzarii TaxID=167371 RepID=A0A4S4KEJ4_9AGAM|nr:hypothetical protein EW145_g7755 [Phellinidium pouzarii]